MVNKLLLSFQETAQQSLLMNTMKYLLNVLVENPAEQKETFLVFDGRLSKSMISLLTHYDAVSLRKLVNKRKKRYQQWQKSNFLTNGLFKASLHRIQDCSLTLACVQF